MSEQVRDMELNKYNNLLTSYIRSFKDTKDSKILALVEVSQKLVDDSNKSS